MTSGWFVVQSHPHLEGRAAEHLCRQGFEVYLPRYLKRRSHARLVTTIKAPLFPRYLFVSADSAINKWRSIGATIGVSQLVSFGGRPGSVAPSIIEFLRSQEQAGVVTLPRRTFRPGDKIRIMDGAFSDCLGLFEEMREEERVCVLLDLLGRKVRVVLNNVSVAAV
jgi:transcriptional antiterminator RfaH